MPSYPVCVTCLSTDSEVDVAGVCSSCSSRGSVRDTRADGTPPPPPRLKAFEADATRTDAATPAPDRPRPAAAVHFPNYTDLVLLERGGMGVVYRATQVRTGRTVALKTMNVVAHGDDRQARRFRTEAEALARLLHPGVVPIFEASEQDGVPFLAMEYVPGGSLAKRLRAGPPVSVREAAELAAGVAGALAAAHARGITHRDVKPSNVLLAAAGKPKLTDFGLACLADATSRMTHPGSAIGTPAYMAPEQADPKAFGPVGPAADLYGLGATLYELLTGRPPFTGDSGVEILYKVCHDAVAPPRSLNPAIPPDLESICLRCLEKRPEDRYGSAALLANALSRFLRGEPVDGPTLAYKAKKFSRRYGKIAAAGLAAVALAGLTGAALVRERPKAESAEEASGRAVKEYERQLLAGEEIHLLTPHQLPKFQRWDAGATALRTNSQPGGDGSLTFESTKMAHLILLPDTLAESYQVTVRLRHFGSESPLGLAGVIIRNAPNEFMDRWQFVSFRDHNDTPSRPEDGTRLRVEDRLTLYKAIDSKTSQVEFRQSEPFIPHGPGTTPYRDLVVNVSPERIEAQMTGLDPDANGRTDRTVSKSNLSDFHHTHWTMLRRRIDLPEPGQTVSRTFGQSLPPISARGALGIAVERSSVAVQSVRVKLRPPIPNP